MRLRLKVWIDADGNHWLAVAGSVHAPTARVYATLMRDNQSASTWITVAEWNALPFYWFLEEEPATERPDAVRPSPPRPPGPKH